MNIWFGLSQYEYLVWIISIWIFGLFYLNMNIWFGLSQYEYLVYDQFKLRALVDSCEQNLVSSGILINKTEYLIKNTFQTKSVLKEEYFYIMP